MRKDDNLDFIVLMGLSLVSLVVSYFALSASNERQKFPTFFEVNTPYGEVLDCTSDGVGSITCDFQKESNS